MPDEYNEDSDFEYSGPSKSQLKREMATLRDLGVKLISAPDELLDTLSDPDLILAIRAARKITKGGARKRQVQYIGKLLRGGIAEEALDLMERLDSSSKAHITQFHQLEQWRERLIAEDPTAVNEVISHYPDVDRQHLRQLVRNAVAEREAGKSPPIHFRKLFQYLKELEDQRKV